MLLTADLASFNLTLSADQLKILDEASRIELGFLSFSVLGQCFGYFWCDEFVTRVENHFAAVR
jgi:hypothetical protein